MNVHTSYINLLDMGVFIDISPKVMNKIPLGQLGPTNLGVFMTLGDT